MLVLARNIGQKIKIGEDITITLTYINKEHNQAKIMIEAPVNIQVDSEEIYIKRKLDLRGKND